MRYVQETFRDQKDIFLDGREPERLVNEAGFVDVKAREIKIELGPWGTGRHFHTAS